MPEKQYNINKGNRKDLQESIYKGKKEGQAKRKEAMLTALKETYGVVKPALDKVGINRHTHGIWLRDDPEYAAAVDGIQEDLLDLGEKALIQKIADMDTQTILFFAKSKLSKRGYTDKQEIHNTGDITIRIVEGEDE